ncbi:LapA family protein [candidate division KSB1 bacterium]|nr:LapA family protein [candidate division KSB1 bacterium]NIR70941.1 LapA family protein [candidate division KSB1 bacterium]NIS23245.1 LapA family protein [candidate division KSB1 bacterium]NIT70127.1 LapA family protein [candidate division KSB1 bacterium]NIU27861.1 LapA family protein [candidate division KSB1 bacterium]
MKPKTIFLLIVVILFAIILIDNSEKTTIELFFFWEASMPLFVLIFSTLVLGLIIGWFTHMSYSRGKYKNKLLKEKERLSASKESSESRTTAEPEEE